MLHFVLQCWIAWALSLQCIWCWYSFVFCHEDVTSCLQSLGNQETDSEVTAESYMIRAIIWQVLMLYFMHKRKEINEVWGTWMSLLTQLRIAEAEVSIKTLLGLIYNVIGRTRLYLQPKVVFTTFFCLLCSLRGSGYPHFMHFWNAITIVASSLQNSFSFLRSRQR